VVGDAAVNVYLLADVDAAVGAGAGDDVRVRETHERVAGTTFL
jgi:D-aminopeptidase